MSDKTGLRVWLFMLLCLSYAVFSGCSDEDISPTDPITDTGNEPPVIQAQSDTSVVVGDTLKLQIVAYDPEGDELTYRIVSYVNGIHDPYPAVGMDTQTARFWFAAALTDVPSRKFAIFVSDPPGDESKTEFIVNVFSRTKSDSAHRPFDRWVWESGVKSAKHS